MTSNIAVVAIQNNFDCSKVITQDQANQPAGLGYRIIFADIVNNTNVRCTPLFLPTIIALLQSSFWYNGYSL